MNKSIYKFYTPSSANLEEKYAEIENASNSYVRYLDTKTYDESGNTDELYKELMAEELLSDSSDVCIDYKKAYTKVRLSKVDWDKVFEADNAPINYEYIEEFNREVNKLYDRF